MTNNPTPYRHKTTGTIAWLNKPYENWVSIAPVLDVGVAVRVTYTLQLGRVLESRLSQWLLMHQKPFPITITSLPEDEWQRVELREAIYD